VDRLLWEILVRVKTSGVIEYLLTRHIVSYADFVLVSFLHFIKRANEEAFTKALEVDEAIKKVYEASGKWLERDGH
jgi:hypothetical protein